MTKQLKIKLDDAIESMIAALESELDQRDIAYATVAAVDNVNSIDDVTDHCGEVRCEHFADLAWEYAGQFGEFGSDDFEKAQWRAVLASWKEFKKRHRK